MVPLLTFNSHGFTSSCSGATTISGSVEARINMALIPCAVSVFCACCERLFFVPESDGAIAASA